jgi:hypothetical protein
MKLIQLPGSSLLGQELYRVWLYFVLQTRIDIWMFLSLSASFEIRRLSFRTWMEGRLWNHSRRNERKQFLRVLQGNRGQVANRKSWTPQARTSQHQRGKKSRKPKSSFLFHQETHQRSEILGFRGIIDCPKCNFAASYPDWHKNCQIGSEL